MADMAENEHDGRDDGDDEAPEQDGDGQEQARMYSPTCSYCWWWKPADRRSCAAYLRANSIPLPIWNGINKHLRPYSGDHQITFVLDPAAEKTPPEWARDAPRVGSPEAKVMLAISEKLKAGKAGQAGKGKAKSMSDGNTGKERG